MHQLGAHGADHGPLAEVLLGAFLREAAAAPFAYGDWDCALTLARWVERLTGIDPAPALRGRYRTRLGWVRIVNRAGGLVPLVGGLAEAAGMQPIAAAPRVGDIAVIKTIVGPAGAIWVGTRWAIKVQSGLTGGPAPALAVWGFR